MWFSQFAFCFLDPRLFPRLIIERAPSGTFEILVLAAAEGPEESGEADAAEAKGDWDKPSERCHDMSLRFLCPSQTAFAVTVIEETDMATAAMSGVTTPIIARGTKMML